MSMSAQDMLQRLRGGQDPRGIRGMISRGRNVYGGGAPQAQAGGGQQFGRPTGSMGLREQPAQPSPAVTPQKTDAGPNPRGNAFGLRARQAGFKPGGGVNRMQQLAQNYLDKRAQAPVPGMRPTARKTPRQNFQKVASRRVFGG